MYVRIRGHTSVHGNFWTFTTLSRLDHLDAAVHYFMPTNPKPKCLVKIALTHSYMYSSDVAGFLI